MSGEKELKWWTDDSEGLIHSLCVMGYGSREAVALLLGAGASIMAARNDGETEEEAARVAKNFGESFATLTKHLMEEKKKK